MNSADVLGSFMIGHCNCLRDIKDSNGDELCDNGVQLSFTNYSWPIGVKRDRGLNITFTKDIILQPAGWLGAPQQTGSGANVAISFKDDKNKYRCVTDHMYPLTCHSFNVFSCAGDIV